MQSVGNHFLQFKYLIDKKKVIWKIFEKNMLLQLINEKALYGIEEEKINHKKQRGSSSLYIIVYFNDLLDEERRKNAGKWYGWVIG